MRRRTQAEMDQLVAAAGFRKLDAAHRRMGHLHRVARAARVAVHERVRAARIRHEPPWPWRRALAWLAVPRRRSSSSRYGLANWSAAQRARRRRRSSSPGSARIPFWAWTILPYWSIDVLYGLSLFVCTTRARARHARQAAADGAGRRGRLLSSLFRCASRSSGRPRTASAALLFDALDGLRQAVQPGAVAAHRAGGDPVGALRAQAARAWRGIALDAWFLLIGASVLTTYQHHFIDIPTGVLLGWLCLWLWPFADDGVRRARLGAGAGRTDPMRVGGWRLAMRWARSPAVASPLRWAGGGCGCSGRRVSLLLVAAVLRGARRGGLPEGRRRSPDASPRAGSSRPISPAPGSTPALWTRRDPAARARSPMASGSAAFRRRANLRRSPFAGVVDLTAEFELRARRARARRAFRCST